MVDRVELALADELQEVRELEAGDAGRLEQQREAAHEVVDVRHVRQHVVRHHQVRLLAAGAQPLGERHAEEFLDDRKAAGARRRRGARGRLDAEALDAAASHVLQQVAVVGGDLDDA